MKDIYIVQHVRKAGVHEDIKMIGAFSSKDAAEAAVASLKTKPGFKELADAFSIDKYMVDQIHWAEGFGEG